MTDWLILVEFANDVRQSETPHKVMSVAEYLGKPGLFEGRRPYVINLARSYAYKSEGYFASLLAEARGHRVAPTVQTMVELSAKTLYAHALPDLNARLRDARVKGAPTDADPIFVAFSRTKRPGFERLGREAADWFRAPALELELDAKPPHEIVRIRTIGLHRLKGDRRDFFLEALAAYTRGPATAPKARGPAKWSLAVLVDPDEKTPPSRPSSVKRLLTVADKMGVDAEILEPSDLTSLAEFDALFIRATTAIDNFAYRFARRAEQEGMPVIDDTMSMIRCTNKVYLKEILEKARLPIPRTEIVDDDADLQAVFRRLGSPTILKTPDGSFGMNMVKASTVEEFQAGAKRMLSDSALVIAQAYTPTTFDWRIGVLGGEPLFACQYRMARGHWQIIRHRDDGKMTEGGSTTMQIADVPPAIIEAAVRAARLIGDGLYGVDLKETDAGVVIIEVNDNPNLETDVEGAVLKDELWRRIIDWFSVRLETRLGLSRR